MQKRDKQEDKHVYIDLEREYTRIEKLVKLTHSCVTVYSRPHKSRTLGFCESRLHISRNHIHGQ